MLSCRRSAQCLPSLGDGDELAADSSKVRSTGRWPRSSLRKSDHPGFQTTVGVGNMFRQPVTFFPAKAGWQPSSSLLARLSFFAVLGSRRSARRYSMDPASSRSTGTCTSPMLRGLSAAEHPGCGRTYTAINEYLRVANYQYLGCQSALFINFGPNGGTRDGGKVVLGWALTS